MDIIELDIVAHLKVVWNLSNPIQRYPDMNGDGFGFNCLDHQTTEWLTYSFKAKLRLSNLEEEVKDFVSSNFPNEYENYSLFFHNIHSIETLEILSFELGDNNVFC